MQLVNKKDENVPANLFHYSVGRQMLLLHSLYVLQCEAVHLR